MGLLDHAATSRRIRRTLAAAIAALLTSGVAALAAEELDTDVEVTWTMVDVTDALQQGDAHLIEIDDRAVLVDAGTYELGRRRLVPYLEDAGIDRLDLVFVSHAHADHYGGLRALLEAGVEIERVEISLPDADLCRRESPWGCTVDGIASMLAMLHDAGIPVGEPSAPMEWHLGDDVSLVLVQRLGTIDSHVDGIDVNDTSMVLRLDIGDTTVLLTGDLNTAAGSHLTAGDLRLRSTVLLKVPHHGTESLPTDEFFAAVNPDFAFVPAPLDLWRGDRSSRPRRWLQAHNVPTFVSGQVGHVKVHLGEDVRIETERPAASG